MMRTGEQGVVPQQIAMQAFTSRLLLKRRPGLKH